MKSPQALDKIFRNQSHAGVYAVSGNVSDIQRAARAAGHSIAKLDLKKAAGKSGLLRLIARELKFPKYFGQNWDALHDCLTDLSWHDANGHTLILLNAKTFAERHKEAFDTAIEIFKNAADHWRTRDKPFWVLVQTAKDWNPGLPKLDGDST